jgi:hypothetical protein
MPSPGVTLPGPFDTSPSPVPPVTTRWLRTSAGVAEFEQGVLYGCGPAQVGFGDWLSSFHRLTLSSRGRLSPEPQRLTRPFGAFRAPFQWGTWPGWEFAFLAGFLLSDFFISSEAPGGIAEGWGPGCPTVTPSGGGPLAAPLSLQPARETAINKAPIKRPARRMEFTSIRINIGDSANSSVGGRAADGSVDLPDRSGARSGSHRLIDQYASELITSPPERVPSPHHACKLTEFLMKCTEPSAKQTLTPPGCRLVAETEP